MMMMMTNSSSSQAHAHTTTTDSNTINFNHNHNHNNQPQSIGINGNGGTSGGPKPRGRRKKVRTEPIRPICPQCEKQFSNQSALTKHKLTHSDERKFACQQCSKAFKRHDHLTGHMQTHSNRKPFNCDVQGCDKTYCDARSLRRHKENIHHIVTPKESSNSNLSNISSSNQQQQTATTSLGLHSQQQQQQPQQQQQQQQTNMTHYESQHQHQPQLTPQPIKSESMNNSNSIIDNNNNNTSNSYHQQAQQHHQYQPHQTFVLQSNNLASPLQPIQQQPSQLYRRRLNSDGGVHDQVDRFEANSMGQPSSGLNPQTIHQMPHLNHQQNHHLHHQPPYSADYASSQTFFGHNYVHNVDSLRSNTIPHSADSVTDSVLGLNIHQYDQQQQLTPQPQLDPDLNSIQHYEQAQQQQQQQPPQLTPQPVTADGVSCNVGLTTLVDNNNNSYNQQQHYQQQQQQQQQQQHRLVLPPSNNLAGSQVNQPSELYKRRLHRLHSDTGGIHDRIEINVGANHLGNMGQPNHHSMSTMHHQHHQNNHHPSYSADYVSTTTFFGNNYMHPIDDSHMLNSTSIPHSADSVTDSGLALNIHYEQAQFEFGHG